MHKDYEINNILIIEDSEYKLEDIISALKRKIDNPNIVHFSNRNDALFYMRDNSNLIDLIILDWNFPLFKNALPEVGMGKSILQEMKRRNVHINTIICSSDPVTIEDELSEDVREIVLYKSFVLLKFEFLDKFNNEDEVIEVQEGNHNNPKIIERESYLKSLEEEKKKQKKLTSYKRKRSSDAWWKK